MAHDVTKADIARDGASLVLPGAAGHIPYLVGVYRAIEEFGVDVVEAVGSSSGCIVDAGVAHGLTADEMLELGAELLTRNRLLRRRPFGLLRDPYGLHSINPLRDALREIFPGQMSDAYIRWGAWLTCAQTSSSVLVRSDRHPTLPTADVVAASCALMPFFTAHRVPGLPGLHYDGGYTANVGSDAFDDDNPDRLVLTVRFSTQGAGRKWRDISGPIDMVRSAAASLIDSASKTHVSRKHWLMTATIKSEGDGLDFDQSRQTVLAKYRSGRDQMMRWLESSFVTR
jgi:predicted acylesterase/phospholipase RssA